MLNHCYNYFIANKLLKIGFNIILLVNDQGFIHYLFGQLFITNFLKLMNKSYIFNLNSILYLLSNLFLIIILMICLVCIF